MRRLGDYENFVYEADVAGQPAVLRLTHRSHRSAEDLRAELDFIRFLAGQGLRACAPIPTLRGAEIRLVGDEFLACCFERAQGQKASHLERALWNERLFAAWGATLARFHQCAEQYRSPPGRPERSHWFEDDLSGSRHFPEQASDLRDRLVALVGQLKQRPSSPETFGLIHADLHSGNFLVSASGELSVFDFDDSCRHWFSYDLAVVQNQLSETGEPAESESNWTTLLDGYQRVRPLPPSFHEELPLLLLLRDLQLYQLMHKKRHPADRDAGWNTRVASLGTRIRRSL